ncbi:MAG: asparagine synthase-related protein [Massilia sp.]
MSGLCGWFSHEPAALPIAQMGAPLCRLDRVPLRCGEHAAGALALAAQPDSGSLLHEDGLLLAIWGGRAASLARLWRSHGANACVAFGGHFAFAILDQQRDEMLIAVDRYATRPMFYQQIGRSIVFASSAEALVEHPGVGREIDPQALYQYLYFQNLGGSAAIYRGVRRLLPGEFVHLQSGRPLRGRYWKMQFHEAQALPRAELENELCDTLRTAVHDAVGQRPAGVLLGGGIGSAALASLMAATAESPLHSFTVGYDVGADHTLADARRVARHCRSTHHERCLTASDVADAIPAIAAACDQPFGDMGMVAAYHLASPARAADAQRVLAGQGGAELFGGSPHYAQQARFSRYESISSALRQTVIEPLLFHLAGGIGGAMLGGARGYIRQALVPPPQRFDAANLLSCYDAATMFDADFLGAINLGAPLAALNQHWWQADGRSEINQMVTLGLQYGLADRELPKMMKAAELAGVEVEFPYLNDAVVAFSARLGARQKLDGARPRPFFRKALGAAWPGKLAPERPAVTLPFAHWLQTDVRLKSLAFDSLSTLKGRRLVKPAFIDSLLQDRMAEHPARHGQMVWLLLMLEQWLAHHRGTIAAAPLVRMRHEPETCR